MAKIMRAFRIEEEVIAAAKEVAAERGESVTEAVTDMLKRYVARHVRSLPPDERKDYADLYRFLEPYGWMDDEGDSDGLFVGSDHRPVVDHDPGVT